MTRQKSFKSRVRARMDKTGESYTTARRQLHDKAAAEPAPAPTTGPPAGQPEDGVRAQQLSDALVRERTGRDWEAWFALLDSWAATTRTHTEIARWLRTEHRVDSWWSQNITVTYEQARGLRAPGQKSDGFFSATASKTVAVPVDRLFAAFTDPGLRERWLPGGPLTIRTAIAAKTLRADWVQDSTRIVVGFLPKGDGKAMVAVEHARLADPDAVAQAKAYWRDRLAVLKRLLEE